MQTETVQWEAVRQLYAKLTETEKEERPEALITSLDTILNDESDEALPLEKLLAYQDRLSTSSASSPGGHAFFNGKHMNVDEVSRQNCANNSPCLPDFWISGLLAQSSDGDVDPDAVLPRAGNPFIVSLRLHELTQFPSC